MSGPASALRLDAETKVAEAPVDHKAELRLWLRLLTCTTLLEGEVRRRLRRQFGETLPRFDLMAQLDRAADGMTLGEVSRRMMVSAGNVTSLVERLVQSGHLERRPAPNDRRAQIIRLTESGRTAFSAMARAHEGWVAELLGGLSEDDMGGLMEGLGRLKHSVLDGIRHGPEDGADG
jgi:DNA-binding MarR family transcriptional regulator